MDRLKDAEARIAELEKMREAEDARERRLLTSVANVYAKREEVGLGPLGRLLERMKVTSGEVEEFFSAEEKEARELLKVATPALQLEDDELKLIDNQARAIRLINPCQAFPSSHAICSWHATSCGSTHSETANALGSCVCNLPNNECNPRVEAFGQGSKGWRSAYVHCWCYFDFANVPSPGTAHISTYVDLHGLYVLRPATAMAAASFSLELEMIGFQYGWSWASATLPVLSLSGDRMGRYDGWRYLEFDMPIGADPFTIRVSAKLRASAKAGGSLAVGDFATGAGNYIRVWCVNPTIPD